MIPKVIHYCWFGRNPLPESAVKCIESWRKFMPDYEIKEWNEDNFDVNVITYTAEAYSAKKYAFVSDYARFWILYHHGGVYFDTDVEVVAPMDDIVEKGAYMGVEAMCKLVPEELDGFPLINPGVGIGAPAGMEFYKKVLDYYGGLRFRTEDGRLNMSTVVVHTTTLLVNEGLQKHDDFQEVAGITIYPQDFFNPFDSLTGRLRKTKRTRSIHWYATSWMEVDRCRQWLSRMSHRIFGHSLYRLKRKLTGRDY